MNQSLQKGIRLLKLNLIVEAKKIFEIILKENPQNIIAKKYLSIIFLKLKNLKEAHNFLIEILESKTADYIDYNNLGIVLFELKQYDEAIKNYNISISLKNDYPQSYNNRGLTYEKLENYDLALNDYNKAIQLKPDFYIAHNNCGNILRVLKDFNQSLLAFKNALSFNPTSSSILSNLGLLYDEMGKFDQALECFNKALEFNPSNSKTYKYRANIFSEKMQYEKALLDLNKYINENPNDYGAKFNKSLINLKLGFFEDGWKDYENRKFQDQKKRIDYIELDKFPLPKISDLKKKKILIYCEQGYGDIIQFFRYINLLDKSLEVTLLTYKNLKKLLRDSSNIKEIIDSVPKLNNFDYVCSLLSLPLIFGTNKNNIPNKIPYIFPDIEKINKWSTIINKRIFKIGICCNSGNFSSRGKNLRSLDISLLNNLSNINNIYMINLEKDFKKEQYNSIKIDYFKGLDETDAFTDTAAIIKMLDLVITCDTAVAHLSGAIGQRTWLLLNKNSEWRWGVNNEYSDWYPTMKLFRQKELNNWQPVFKKVIEELKTII
jgi:tetratricopeptide (TPR) repeat protein